MNNHKILIALLGILAVTSAPSCCTQEAETTQTIESEDTTATPFAVTDYDSDDQMQIFTDANSESAEIDNSVSDIAATDSISFNSDILPDTDYNSASDATSDTAADENSSQRTSLYIDDQTENK